VNLRGKLRLAIDAALPDFRDPETEIPGFQKPAAVDEDGA
jgi:hypothetical protein